MSARGIALVVGVGLLLVALLPGVVPAPLVLPIGFLALAVLVIVGVAT